MTIQELIRRWDS